MNVKRNKKSACFEVLDHVCVHQKDYLLVEQEEMKDNLQNVDDEYFASSILYIEAETSKNTKIEWFQTTFLFEPWNRSAVNQYKKRKKERK